ncbi:transposase (fragment) [Bradyrhizobium vignae]|uniref:Transposase n=1 Tax=Bradyrhizobium vignae TaxID=1549949 RepID=A0A2U3QA48_9BRAD
MKTNRWNTVSLARLVRAGELTAVWVPDEGHEAMRDLVRARSAAVEGLRVHWQQVSAFMLMQGRTYPRKKSWTMRYLRRLREEQLDDLAHQIARSSSRRQGRVDRLKRTIEEFVSGWSLGPIVRALQT